MDLLETLDHFEKEGRLPAAIRSQLEQFYHSYLAVVERQGAMENLNALFYQFLDHVAEQCAAPHQFEPFHKRITSPVNYYQFGIDLMSGLINMKASSLSGHDHLARIMQQIENKENVVFLANHQTEADPQLFSILVQERYPHLAEEVIFVAGGRVLTDPMAIPCSLGRNLLCVYSKKHIENPPEKRAEKQAHNAATMRTMHRLLSEGGHAIYVAPSGGRDRPNANGMISVDQFDPAAVEMFRLMSSRATRPCHFYPLALATYHILPPPSGVGTDIGEPRYTEGGPIHMAFGPEIDMNHFLGSEESDRQKRRAALAHHTWGFVRSLYETFPEDARRA